MSNSIGVVPNLVAETFMVSVVIPIFNEEENLVPFYRRLSTVMKTTGNPWEAIFVNDGSRDRSAAILRRLQSFDSNVKVLNLSRNFGHQPAVTAGIHSSVGQCVVLIDGDLQDPPEVIPEMIASWKAGASVVIGQRKTRGDLAGTRGVGFRLFYPLFRRISDLPSTPDAGIFGLMDRKVVDEFNKLPERNRFIPGLRAWLGFKQVSVYYDRQDRAAGKPKQTLQRLIKYAIDGMLSFSTRPLRSATYLGFIIAIVAFALAVFYLVTFFTEGKTAGSGFTTTILCVLFLGSVQLISTGILGEYIGRIYEEIKQRPLYVVQDKLGF